MSMDAVWDWPGLSPAAARAWQLLWRESREGRERIVVTFEWLGEAVGKSRSSAQRYLAELAVAGLVRRIARQVRGFLFEVVDPEAAGALRIARLDPQRRLPAVDDADHGPKSGPSSVCRSGPKNGPGCGPGTGGEAAWPVLAATASEVPADRAGPARQRPPDKRCACPVAIVDGVSPTVIAPRAPKKSLTRDLDLRDLSDLGALVAEAAGADATAAVARLEASAESLCRTVADSDLQLGFCRKVVAATLADGPDGGRQLPKSEVKKILERMEYRWALAPKHPDRIGSRAGFFIRAVMDRYREINGRHWPRTPWAARRKEQAA